MRQVFESPGFDFDKLEKALGSEADSDNQNLLQMQDSLAQLDINDKSHPKVVHFFEAYSKFTSLADQSKSG